MGVVYKAEDVRLNRLVVLKFLLPHTLQSGEIRERFMREAQALALLDHANICTVFEIDEVSIEGEEQTFIAMQYVGQRHLGDMIAKGPMPLARALDIACQVGRGLARSHSRGIVHRDIKPANIMLTEDEIPKIVDFGLAGILARGRADTAVTQLTEPGTVSGTFSYMSPEQVAGRSADHRTDVWALGVVIYQMLSGQLPFRAAEIPALINAVLNYEPEALTLLRPDIPPQVEWIVSKAIAKSTFDRYDSIQEMADDLEAVGKHGTDSEITVVSKTKSPTSIAVLPFRDMSPNRDQGYICEGIAEEIMSALMQVDGLRIASRGSAFHFGQDYDVREVGRQLNVSQVAEGSLRRVGNRLRISAQLTNATDGYQLWSQRFDRDADDIFEIQDEISMGIFKQLNVDVSDDEIPIRRYTDNVEAYNLYLKGRYYWNNRVSGAMQSAMENYRNALEIDPNFAPAYCGMADCSLVLGYYGMQQPELVMPRAKAAAEKALEIDPKLAEAQKSLGAAVLLYEYDWAKAEYHLDLATEQNPNYALGYMWRALLFDTATGRMDEAIHDARQAQKLDPLTWTMSIVVGASYFFAGEYERAVKELKTTIEMDPRAWMGHFYLGRAYWERGLTEDAIQELQNVVKVADLALVKGHLGAFYAEAGREQDAGRLLAEMDEQSKDKYVPAASRALVYAGLGDVDTAMDWLEKAYAEHSPYLIWLQADPAYEPLRNDSRFTSLVERIGLAAVWRKARGATQGTEPG